MATQATSHRSTGATAPGHPLRSRPFVILVAGLAVLVCVGWLTLMYGSVNLTLPEAAKGFTSDNDLFLRAVVWEIRYPRWLDGVMVGAALAVSGALLQGVTRNPLADPTILGITAAAGLASSTLIVIDRSVPQWGVAMAAAVGGLVGAMAIFFVAYRGAISHVRLALAGVALSAFFSAGIVALLSSSRTFLQTNLGFLAGGLWGSEWQEFEAALPYMIAGMAIAMLLSGRLNVLSLGDDVAAGLGVATDQTRLLALGACGVLTAAAVSIAGLVGFVGLVCPHLARFTTGSSDNRLIIPLSALYGGILVTSADLIAKLVIRPTELPMGIITAAVGAPFLLYLVKFKA